MPSSLVVLDINLDGIQDVFITGIQSSFHQGLQDDTFAPAAIYDKPGVEPVVLDFNRDYVPDIVMTSADSLEFIERNYCEP